MSDNDLGIDDRTGDAYSILDLMNDIYIFVQCVMLEDQPFLTDAVCISENLPFSIPCQHEYSMTSRLISIHLGA